MTDLENELLKALRIAYQRSCERSESRVKWTMADQTAHEIMQSAILRAEAGNH